MMLRLRPRAISPTSTAIFPVPISTAAIILLLLEITFPLALRSWLDGESRRGRAREPARRAGQLHGHLPLEREVDGPEPRLRQQQRPVDDIVELGDLFEIIPLP